MNDETQQEPETDYRREQRLKSERLAAIHTATATAMGAPWALHTEHAEDHAAHHQLRDDSGHRLYLNFVWNNSKRLKITGSWPQHQDGTGTSPRDLHYNAVDHEITVSSDKTPEQIAADIKRRFLPDYLATWNKLKERVDKSNQFENDKAAAWERLLTSHAHLDAKGYKPYHAAVNGLKDGYGTVDMSSANSITIELRSLPYTIAAAILAAINRATAEERTK